MTVHQLVAHDDYRLSAEVLESAYRRFLDSPLKTNALGELLCAAYYHLEAVRRRDYLAERERNRKEGTTP